MRCQSRASSTPACFIHPTSAKHVNTVVSLAHLSGKSSTAVSQAKSNGVTDLALLEARCASASVKLQEVMQRVQRLKKLLCQVRLIAMWYILPGASDTRRCTKGCWVTRV